MARQMTRKEGIVWGVAIGVALALIGALLIGPLSEKADARPMCTVETAGCPEGSRVATKKQGVKKFKNGKIDRAPKNVPYTKKARQAIAVKVMRVHNAQVSKQRGHFAADSMWSKAEAWQHVRRTDTCINAVEVGPAAPRGWMMTCDGIAAWSQFQSEHPKSDWKPWHIRVSLCGGMTWIAYKGALATPIIAAGGRYTIASIIAGGIYCAWGKNIENLAD